MPAPVWRSNGVYTSGTGTTTIAFPAGYDVDDILVLCFETGNNTGAGMSGLTTQTQTNLTNNGWTRVANSNSQMISPTVAASQNTMQDIWWTRASTTSQTAVSIADTGDHTLHVMHAFKGAIKTGNPWNDAINIMMTSASAQTTSKNLTTTYANTLIVTVINAPQDSASAFINASPLLLINGSGDDTELTERSDLGTTSGHGGAIGVITHRKPSAAAVANVRANTLTSNVSCTWMGALRGTLAYNFGDVCICS